MDGILFDSAIWGDGEIEQILIDFVLHETGVRGNSWSTVNGKLSAVRHANVQAGKGNPRDGKLRLKQLMAGLKKFRGPTGKKGPLTIAMLKLIQQLLESQPCADNIVIWASLIVAFHLFCRSCEYLAKLSAGRFDLEAVFLLAALVFYCQGIKIPFSSVLNRDGTLRADQAELTFGKTKTGGGEVRTLSALHHPLCPVMALAKMVTVVPHKRSQPDHKGRTALFAWGAQSTRSSEGVTYHDMQMLLKQAATALGTDPSTIATHSIRRGAASMYLMSGKMTYDFCKLWGRWKSEAVREYVQVWDTMTSEVSLAVVNNVNSATLRVSVDLPSRDSQDKEAERRWQQTVREAAVPHPVHEPIIRRGEARPRLIGTTAGTPSNLLGSSLPTRSLSMQLLGAAQAWGVPTTQVTNAWGNGNQVSPPSAHGWGGVNATPSPTSGYMWGDHETPWQYSLLHASPPYTITPAAPSDHLGSSLPTRSLNMQLLAAAPRRRKQVSLKGKVACFLRLIERLDWSSALQVWMEQMQTEREQQIEEARSIAAHMRMCINALKVRAEGPEIWERSTVNGDYLPSYDILPQPTFTTSGHKRDYECLSSPMEEENSPEELPFITASRAQRYAPCFHVCPEAQMAKRPGDSLLWAKVDEATEGDSNKKSKVIRDFMCVDVEEEWERGAWHSQGKPKDYRGVTVLNYKEVMPIEGEEEEDEDLLIPPWMLEPGNFTEDALATWPLPADAELQ